MPIKPPSPRTCEIRLKVSSEVKARLSQHAAEQFTSEASVVTRLIMGITTVVPAPPAAKTEELDEELTQ